MHTVKEIARELDMSAHTVRYYTDIGLVPSLQRDQNGHRLFDEESKNWLIGVKNLRGSGMSVQAVKEYVDLCLEGEGTINVRYGIIQDQKKQLEAQLQQLNERHRYMEQKMNWYADIMEQRIPDNSSPGTWNKSASEVNC